MSSLIVEKLSKIYLQLISGVLNLDEVLSIPNSTDIQTVKNNITKVDPGDPCNIQFTSGTTGSPKAALLSHFNFVNNGIHIGKRAELDLKAHRICVQVPLFHAFGVVITTMSSLHYGATMVLPGKSFKPDASIHAIVEEKYVNEIVYFN